MEEIFSIKCRQKGIQLSTTVREGVPAALLLDEGHLRQILFNLVGNAIKFTEKGEVQVIFSAAYEENDYSTVDLNIEIRDTGIGIPGDKIEIIFREFEQRGREISNRYGGTGLGLSICKKLVDMLDGHISVSSKVNEGSTFRLSFPDVVTASVVDEGDSAKMLGSDSILLNKSVIMVVDDNDTNRQLVVEFLKDQPTEIIEARDGGEAVDIAREQLPDLILMDLRMPNMNGFEAMKKIKRNKQDTVVIALTASGFLGYGNEIQELGFDGYMRKPVSQGKLLRVLGERLGYQMSPEKGLKTAGVNVKSEVAIDISHLSTAQRSELLEIWIPLLRKQHEKIDREEFVVSQHENLNEIIQGVGSRFGVEALTVFSRELSHVIEQFDIEADHL